MSEQSERAPLEMTYISKSPRVICEGTKRLFAGGSGRGCPRTGKFLHLEPEKTVSDAYFGQRLLGYDFLQIASGPEIITIITSSFKHAVSDIFILLFSERAPLGITYIYFHASESNMRGSEAG